MCLSLYLIHLQSADIISTVEFDSTGNYLATGDKGGRVVLFERNEAVSPFLLVARWSGPALTPHAAGMHTHPFLK